MNPWLLLAVAIVCETVGSTALKASAGFTQLLPSLLVVAGFGLSFYLTSQVMQRLPLGLVYAIWAGAGTALTAVAGLLIFGESLGPVQIAGIALIIGGIVVLQATAAAGGGDRPA
ncbi:MAG: multidrug efflux SMR transporter [Chloroflexi bacterium]|nr:multidrug efflux SMR transporter [Chloroflexota bacterium]